MTEPSRRNFDSGRIVTTTNVANWLTGSADRHDFATDCLARHGTGDWGDVAPDTSAGNDHALIHGHRLLSAYTLPHRWHDTETTLWIITDADRKHHNRPVALRLLNPDPANQNCGPDPTGAGHDVASARRALGDV